MASFVERRDSGVLISVKSQTRKICRHKTLVRRSRGVRAGFPVSPLCQQHLVGSKGWTPPGPFRRTELRAGRAGLQILSRFAQAPVWSIRRLDLGGWVPARSGRWVGLSELFLLFAFEIIFPDTCF